MIPLLFAAAAVAVALMTGFVHDHVAYQAFWEAALSGRDPWSPSFLAANPYGPFFLLLAIPYAIDPYAAKLTLVAAWLIALAIIRKERCRTAAARPPAWIWLSLAAFSPFVWLEVPYYAHFDVLVGLLTLMALRSLAARREGTAGTLIAVGSLFKFYPALIVPSLLVRAGTARRALRLGLSAAAVFAAGMLIGYLAYGDALLRPFTVAAERESKFISPFMFLRAPSSPARLLFHNPDLDRYWYVGLAICLLAAVAICVRRRLDTLDSAIVAGILGFLGYKVGHPQFLFVIVLLLAWRWAIRPGSRSLLLASLCYVAFLSCYQAIYAFLGGMLTEPWVQVRYLGGLPFTLLAIWLVAAVARDGRGGT
jgi:hypothetical protein